MKVKKLLSLSLAIALLFTFAFSANATEDVTPEVVGISGNNILGVAAEEATAQFAYTANEDASATLTADVDSNVMSQVYANDFDDLEIGAVAPSKNNGNGYYGGPVGVTAAVVDNPKRETEGDNCAKIGDWKAKTFVAYDGTSYDATFWLRLPNDNAGRHHINIKPDVFAAYRGAEHKGVISLYLGYSDPGTTNLFESDSHSLMAQVTPGDYGLDARAGFYWRVVSTYNNVKIYFNDTDDFTNIKPVFDLNLSGSKMGERSILSFANGNTEMLIDDIVINEIGKTPSNDGDEGKKLVLEEDFENYEALPENHTLVISNDGSVSQLQVPGKPADGEIDTTLVENIKGNYTASFYAATAGGWAWDRVCLRIGNGYALSFRGTESSLGKPEGYDADYIAGITNEDVWNPAKWYAVTVAPAQLRHGMWIKVEVIDNVIKVWLRSVAEYDANGFEGDYNLTYKMPEGTADTFSLSAKNGDAQNMKFDDLKIDCETFTYENDFSNNLPALSSYISTLESGNTVYLREKGTDEWKVHTLFSTPENYEMTLWVNNTDLVYTGAQIFIRNNLRIDFIKSDGNDGNYIKLMDGTTELGSYKVESSSALGLAPFQNGYMKIIVNNGDVNVYGSKTADFAEESLILSKTDAYTVTTNKFIRIKNGNTNVEYDDFKVYDLDNTGTNIGAGYKQLVMNGTDMKLVSIVDGITTELAAYTLPFANAKYEITVAKTNDKLIVYVNGKSVMEIDSTAAGFMYFEGSMPAYSSKKYIAPMVYSAGDFDNSGKLEVSDLLTIRGIVLGDKTNHYYTEVVNVDESADLVIDARDVVRLKKMLAEIVE